MEDEEFDLLSPEEKKKRFQEAVDLYNRGFVEENYAIRSIESVLVEEAMEDANVDLSQFSQSQKKVIFEAAYENMNLDYFMNPKFSATHMSFIFENLKAGRDVTWLPVGKYHMNIVRKPLTRNKIADIRRRMSTAPQRESLLADLQDKKKKSQCKETKKQSMKREER